MPSCRTYQVTRREEGKAALQDQSYRVCVLTLLVFFFLFAIIIIIACLPWKNSGLYNHGYSGDSEEAQHHYGSHITTSTTESAEIITEKDEPIKGGKQPFERYLNNASSPEVTHEPVTTLPTTSKLKEGQATRMTTEVTEEPETSLSTSSNVEEVLSTRKSAINYTLSSTDITLKLAESTTLSILEEKGTSTEDSHSTSILPFIKNRHETSIETTTDEYVTTTEYPSTSFVTNNSNTFLNDDTLKYTTQEYTTENRITSEIINNQTNSATFESTNSSAVTTELMKIYKTSTESYTQTTTDLISSSTIKSTDTSIDTTTEMKATTDDIISTTDYTTKYITDSSTNHTESTTESTTETSPEVTTPPTTISTADLTTNFATNTATYFHATNASSTESETESITEISTTDSTPMEEPSTKSTIMPVTATNIITSTQTARNEKVCITGKCKQKASQMLFYMNHTADPCDDFYEYACGGFESSPQTIEQNLENIAYQRIARQMRKKLRVGSSQLFNEYYNNCMRYESVNITERIKLAKEALSEVGIFYTASEWAENPTNFTELFAKLLLHHSALLFDVGPDLDEYSPEHFTLKIGPTTYRSPFDTIEKEDPCYASQFQREQELVDLGKLYKEYKTCKNNTRRFINSIAEALTALGVFNELNNTYNISQHIQTTVINIDMEIVQSFFENYPPKQKIRESYLTRNYTYVTFKQLDEDCKLINWTQLIYMLTNENVMPEGKIQVYFYDELVQGLKNLEDFRLRSPMELNNALLGLYARNLYHKFVLSKHWDVKKHCLRVASNLLIPEASNLYVSSFAEDELSYMNGTIHKLFDELKATLKLKVEKAEWAAEKGLEELLKKIDDIKVVAPDISYFNDVNSTYRSHFADEINLTDNYLKNSMILMRRYRAYIYKQLLANPGHSEQIWTHYATPYQSKGLAIYGLNLVVIPFGVVDWSANYNETSFDYLLLATLGNVIAHQLAHHFDANGVHYWNGTRDIEYSLLADNEFTKSTFESYIKCQNTDLYQWPINMTLPSTGQTVSFKISQLTLNERLSEIMGLRLAYDTLDRLRSRDDELYLPWLEIDFNQLFYLAYAQMHCTKTPITSSYISLYEDEQLPSRVRIFVSASQNQLVGKAWNCPDGSQITPSYTCGVFPYLQNTDNIIYSE